MLLEERYQIQRPWHEHFQMSGEVVFCSLVSNTCVQLEVDPWLNGYSLFSSHRKLIVPKRSPEHDTQVSDPLKSWCRLKSRYCPGPVPTSPPAVPSQKHSSMWTFMSLFQISHMLLQPVFSFHPCFLSVLVIRIWDGEGDFSHWLNLVTWVTVFATTFVLASSVSDYTVSPMLELLSCSSNLKEEKRG